MKSSFVFVPIILFLFSSCTIKDAYLLHSDVDAPLVEPPLHIASSKPDETINLNFELSGIKSKNINGVVSKYEENHFTDSIYNGNNINWKPSPFKVGFNINFNLSRVISFFTGFSYTGNDQNNGMGGNFGLGLKGGDSVNHYRLDLGLNFQSTFYSALYYADAEFLPWDLDFSFIALHEENKTNVNPFTSFTFNTSHRDWFANPFIQLSYFQQNLFKVKVGGGLALNEVYIESDVNIFNVKPGLTFTIGENYFLSAGASMQYLTGVNKSSQQFFIKPFLQMNFSF